MLIITANKKELVIGKPNNSNIFSAEIEIVGISIS